MTREDKICLFEDAFSTHTGGCRRTCDCGREFYDAENTGYDWEEDEFEKLEADPKATPLGYSVGTVSFEGTEYVMDCLCWHERGLQIMRFLDSHDCSIADYFKRLKEKRRQEADAVPTIQDDD